MSSVQDINEQMVKVPSRVRSRQLKTRTLRFTMSSLGLPLGFSFGWKTSGKKIAEKTALVPEAGTNDRGSQGEEGNGSA